MSEPHATTDERQGLPSASGFQRILSCPGSFHLSRGLSTSEKSWTRQGTAGHALLAGEETDEEASDDTAEQAATCERYFAELAESMGFGEGCIAIGGKDHPAERLWLHNDRLEPVASGEPDRVRIRTLPNGDKEALIVDFKLGRKAVATPNENPQLIGYALLLQEEYGLTGAYLQIIQPWAKRMDPAYISAEGLATWRAHILDALTAAQQPDAPRFAGPHCDYCPARPICPQAREVVHSVLREPAQSGPLSLPHSFWLMTPAEKLKMWDWVQHAKKTLKELEDLYKVQLSTEPESIPGLRVKPETETLTVTGTAMEKLFESLSPDRAMHCFKATLTSLASVAVGGKPDAKSLTKDGKTMKERLRLALGDEVKATKRAGAIERI